MYLSQEITISKSLEMGVPQPSLYVASFLFYHCLKQIAKRVK